VCLALACKGCSFISGHQRTLASPPTRRPGGQPEVRWLQRVRGTPVGTQWGRRGEHLHAEWCDGYSACTGQSRPNLGPMSGQSRPNLGPMSGQSRTNLGPMSGQSRGDLVRVLGEHLVLGAISREAFHRSGGELLRTVRVRREVGDERGQRAFARDHELVVGGRREVPERSRRVLARPEGVGAQHLWGSRRGVVVSTCMLRGPRALAHSASTSGHQRSPEVIRG